MLYEHQLSVSVIQLAELGFPFTLDVIITYTTYVFCKGSLSALFRLFIMQSR